MDIDTNIDNYTTQDLYTILGIQDVPKDKLSAAIITSSSKYIQKYSIQKNTEMVSFFQEIKDRLLSEETPSRYVPEMAVPERKPTDNVFNVGIERDVLNPTLKNTLKRTILIDSQYRDDTYESITSQDDSFYEKSGGDYSNTYFNANLNEKLYNVLSITVTSVNIPNNWYTIDRSYNNNFFWITNNHVDFLIVLPSGNYRPEEFVIAMNKAIIGAGFVKDGDFIEYDNYTNKVTLTFSGTVDPKGSKVDAKEGAFVPDISPGVFPYFTFYDVSGTKMENYVAENGSSSDFNLCTLSNLKLDGTLGWLMGYRLPYENIFVSGNPAQVPINLAGTQYFFIMLVDYQTNRVTNDVVTLTNTQDVRLGLPNYINPSLLSTCIPIEQFRSPTISEKTISDDLLHKTNLAQTKILQYIPSAPRILTQAQMYSTNQIIKNNQKRVFTVRNLPPTMTDIICVVPINKIPLTPGEIFIENKFQANDRIYFGPVDIERFTVRLLNDKGQIVNLNGSNWSFILSVEVLYQY
jgi:hypothetical protein